MENKDSKQKISYILDLKAVTTSALFILILALMKNLLKISNILGSLSTINEILIDLKLF